MSNNLRVGAACRPIDLPPGLEMAGYARRSGPAEGTLTPLEARAIALDDGSGPGAVVVVLDILYVTEAITRRIEQELSHLGGTVPQRILVSATHTHSGPRVGDPDSAAGQLIVAAAVQAGAAALANAQPAALAALEVPIPDVGRNRRHGTASADPAAHVLVATAADEPSQVVATVFEYACHATVLEHDTLGWSPDWPGYARQALEQLVGGTAVFLQGCAGDINPIFVNHSDNAARLVGTNVGGRVGLAVADRLQSGAGRRYVHLSWNRDEPVPDAAGPVSGQVLTPGQLWSRDASVGVTVAALPEAESAALHLAEVRAAWKAAPPGPARDRIGAQLGQAWADDLRARSALTSDMVEPMTAGGDLSVTVRALGLGQDSAIVGLPGEHFSAAAAGLRAQVPPGQCLLLAGYARQSIGYLPPRSEYPESGYEVGAAYLAEGAAEAIVDACATTLGY